MKALPHALLGLALLSGGVIAGRSFSSPPTSESPKEIAPSRVPRDASSGGSDTSPPKDKHDLAGMRDRFRAWSERGGDLKRELERLPRATLESLIIGHMAESGKGNIKERQARQSVISAALLELYRREGVAAYEWVDALDDKQSRNNGMRTLLMATVRNHPDAALPWIRQYQKENNRSQVETTTFSMLALAGAAQRDAEEAIRIYGLFGEKMRGTPFRNVKFADDFDFGKFHTALAGKAYMGEVFTHWSTRNKDAAWQAVKGDIEARGEPAGQYFGSLVLGAVAADGEKSGVEWAAQRLAELTRDQRRHCLQNLDTGKLTVEGISAFVTALPTDEKKEFALRLLNGAGGGAKAFVSLDALSRPDLLEILEASSKRNAALFKSTDSYSAGYRKLYQEVEGRYSLTPEEIQRILPKTNPGTE